LTRLDESDSTQYGPPDVLQFKEIATPAPADDEVLIKLYAASVNPLDSFSMKGPLFFLPMIGRLLKPRHEVIGCDGQIQRGHKVLVEGASGGVGTYAVQIAKSFGTEVTAVCITRNVDTARSIGADHVIDYTREDFTQSGPRYDLILGVNSHRSIFDYRRALSRDGSFVLVGGGLARILQAMLLAPFLSRTGSKKRYFFIAKMNTKDLVFLKDLLEAGQVVPVIDRRLERAPILRQPVKTQFSLNGEGSHEYVSKAVHQRI
jgi:NADPH:quinone reductase-like Zn-dependent oxidoreductase